MLDELSQALLETLLHASVRQRFEVPQAQQTGTGSQRLVEARQWQATHGGETAALRLLGDLAAGAADGGRATSVEVVRQQVVAEDGGGERRRLEVTPHAPMAPTQAAAATPVVTHAHVVDAVP